jgi:hypothetical protein
MTQAFDRIAWSNASRFWLVNASSPACFIVGNNEVAAIADDDGVVRVDILIEDGRTMRVECHDGTAREDSVDLGGRQVWPTLVDVHTHLEGAHHRSRPEYRRDVCQCTGRGRSRSRELEFQRSPSPNRIRLAVRLCAWRFSHTHAP